MNKVFIIVCALALSAALPVDDKSLAARAKVEVDYGEAEPFFNAEQDVRFLLFTRFNPTIGQQILFRDLDSVRNSHFNGELPTRVIIHGFQSDSNSDVNILLTAAFLRNSDVNVIVGKFWMFCSSS